MQPDHRNDRGPHISDNQDAVACFLGDSATHRIPGPVVRIDTHGAMVFLAGPLAYKIKRAVRYPYLDYSSLEKRRLACLHEIDVNRDNAPEIYLDVMAITRDEQGNLHLGGGGEPVEWTVKMRRFDEKATLDHVSARGPLPDALIGRLARTLIDAHRRGEKRETAPWITDLAAYIDYNETGFKEWPELFDFARVHSLSEACRAWHRRLVPLIEQRGRMGYVRHCHGDCHLGNIVLIEDRPILFDAIEFDEQIASGDVLYDLAFLLMDLWHRGDKIAANRLLTEYLVAAGQTDHLEGLAALPFYMALRACIRVNVTASRLPFLNEREAGKTGAVAQRYFKLAEALIDPATPSLTAIGGLSGSGKSTLAKALAPSIGAAPGAIILRSDVERKIMHGIGETDRLDQDAYHPDVTREVYHRLMLQARTTLASGHSVIVDAVFARPEERIAIAHIAEAVEVPFTGLWLEAPSQLLEARVDTRSNDASDADSAVVRRQLEYDIGDLNWVRIDASGATKQTLTRAYAALKSKGDEDN